MRRDPRKYLFDIRQAADLVVRFTAGRTFGDYIDDPMLRSAVERQFEIIGEALSQLTRVDPDLAARIGSWRQIVGFRNMLIHGYADIDDELVWDVVQGGLPELQRTAAALLADLGDADHHLPEDR